MVQWLNGLMICDVPYKIMVANRGLSCYRRVEAKLATKPMTIEDIVTIAYADEIEAENRLRERKARK